MLTLEKEGDEARHFGRLKVRERSGYRLEFYRRPEKSVKEKCAFIKAVTAPV